MKYKRAVQRKGGVYSLTETERDPWVLQHIYDSYAMWKFTGIDFLTDSVPDETMLCNFRHLLEWFIKDESAWTEPKNPYYTLHQDPELCEVLLKEFDLEGSHCHIINGHVPVKVKKGESPIKGNGKLIVIDCGFCKAYQSTSGIAGYTLVYNSHGYRIIAHQPFAGRDRAILENFDIASSVSIFERFGERQKVSETDKGTYLQSRISDLRELLAAYKAGIVTENHTE